MKFILSCLLFLTAAAANAQIQTTNQKNNPAWVVDSVQYKKLPIMDINSIVEISVLKDAQPGKYPNGVVFVKTKPEIKCNFIKLETVVQQHVGKAKSFMAMVDGEFITDLTDVLIDSSYILRCETMSTRDFVYLQHMPEMMIIKITTATKENKEKAAAIRLRG